MDAKRLFIGALMQATAVIDKVQLEDFSKPTPDHEWDVQALTEHMLRELCWVPDLISGKTSDEVGGCFDGELIGNALQANWHAAAERARNAVVAADLSAIAHLSTGDSTVEDYLRQAGTDQLIHAWDVGEAVNEHVQFAAPLIAAAQEYIVPRIRTLQEAGLFAPSVTVPATADAQTKLLAVTGRRVNWPAM
jgi:uncharacterized protein (TIGR03086 family)